MKATFKAHIKNINASSISKAKVSTTIKMKANATNKQTMHTTVNTKIQKKHTITDIQIKATINASTNTEVNVNAQINVKDNVHTNN